MKKILLALLCLPSIALAAQQEITAVPASPANPSIGSLKTAINLRLADIDENFDEIYPIIEAGPVYVNASAPADTKVVWIDTDQNNAIKAYIGGAWTVVGTAGEAYTYPSAAGVANWNGSAWGTSYTVGTGASNLVQLNASSQLPAVSADLLTITDTGAYFTTDTVGAALQKLGSGLADVTEITLDASLTETGGVLSVTNPVTDYDTDGDGDFTDEAWFPVGTGYTDLTQYLTQTAWRLFYSDGSGDVTELALGASGTVLQSNGATAAPTWETPTGGSYPEGYMEIDGGDSTSTTFAGVIDGGSSI